LQGAFILFFESKGKTAPALWLPVYATLLKPFFEKPPTESAPDVSRLLAGSLPVKKFKFLERIWGEIEKTIDII